MKSAEPGGNRARGDAAADQGASPVPSLAWPTVRKGRVFRHAVGTTRKAHCPTCGTWWTGDTALLLGTEHVDRAGHAITAEYTASFVYWPVSGAR